MEYFIDKRIMVTGKKSHIYLDNPFNLTEHILDSIYLYGMVGAKNGLNIQTVLSGSGVSTNYVALGGTLDTNTTITGAAFNLTLTGLNTYSSSSVNTSITASSGMVLDANIFVAGATSSFRLQTPQQKLGNVTDGQYLRLTASATGTAEWDDLPPTNYVLDFIITDWVAQRITILAVNHTRGTQPAVQVQNGLGTWVVILPLGIGNPLVEVKLQGNGDVELLSTLGLEFNGRVIIT